MSPAKHRSADAWAGVGTAVVVALLGVTAFAIATALTASGLSPVAFPAALAASGQETIVDLSSVESAPEYRTEAPKGEGFFGSEAAVLGRSLARINKALGTSLRPDERLAQLARWVYDHLGPDDALPQQGVFDLLTHRLGLAEPLPHLLMTRSRDAPRLANVVSARLARIFDLADYTHIGGVAEREAGGVVVVIALSRRHVEMAPVPSRLSVPGEIALDGRLVGAFTRPELAHTLPSGETRIEPLGQGPGFSIRVDLAEPGRHRLEILGQGPGGPDVIANFPVYVGVPVDETAEAAAAPKRAATPDEAQQRLLELINADRSKAGLDALAFDPELADVALKHSEDMHANDFVGHISPAMGGSEERLLRAGVATGLAAECVGKGYSPDEIHSGLMNSPGHRAAILLREATHVGIGIVSEKENDRTSYLVTELFIRRIPPLGSEAKVLLLEELNGLRGSTGAAALEEDAGLSELAGETASEFLGDHALTQDGVMARLKRRIAQTVQNARSVMASLAVVGSIEEAAKQAASNPSVERARRVGVGIAQGTRPGLVPNSIIVVLIYVE